MELEQLVLIINMTFKKGNKVTEHKKGCKCFRCSKIPWNKGRHDLPEHTKEWKQNVSNKLQGRDVSRETRDKLRSSALGRKMSQITKDKLSSIKKSNPPMFWLGKNHREETKIKTSLAKKGKKYPIEQYPNSGWRNKHPSNETKKKLRLAIEVDEKPKTRDRDIERQKIIEDTLNCTFMRIKDYD